MKISSNILIIILSLGIFILPAVVYGKDHHQAREMSCCAGEHHSCHSSQKENQPKKEQQNDCNDTSCPMNNCHVQTLSIQPDFEQEIQKEDMPDFMKKTINNHYSTLILKELIYSFWHPPKYISSFGFPG